MSAADVLELSDERDRSLTRLLAAERAVYESGLAEGYKAGYERGARVAEREFEPVARLVLSMAGKDRPDLAELELLRWGPGGREHFADPREGDGHAAEVRRNATASGLIGNGLVHMGGRPVHQHYSPCIPACSAYRPGWYTFRTAAKIMRTLPDCVNYRAEIARLDRLADEYEAGQVAA